MFVDRVEIKVKAGNGGVGCVSFRRLRYVPKGGPDGGDGGHGGSVTIQAMNGVNNLASLAQHKFWHAPDGKNGEGADRTGRGGKDLLIQVPPGTIVMDAEKGFVIKDLALDGDQVVAARGGRGEKASALMAEICRPATPSIPTRNIEAPRTTSRIVNPLFPANINSSSCHYY